MYKKNNTFRSDINGLRAWAVMAVVLFHLGVGLDGGFVGVDVFFVISGFLMTSIILRGLEKNSFSFAEFCLARARRILPALVALIVVLLILGWFWLPSTEYKELGSLSASALVFLSNILLWSSTGYFDTDASDKWLLHTWSLSIEWQFYMLLPVFFIILWRLKASEKTLFVGMIFLVLASFFISAIATPKTPSAAYYLLPTRAWEMAAGGIVFFLSRHGELSGKAKQLFQWLAWPVLLTSMLLFNDSYQWPGLWAVFPVLATMLLLLVNNNDSPLTANALAQWLGDRSYSIYLWHWPVIVALHFMSLEKEVTWIVFALLLTLILGELSYQFIEKQSQHLNTMSSKRQTSIIGGALAASILVSMGIYHANFKERMPADVEIADQGRLDVNPTKSICFDPANEHGSPSCVYGNAKNIQAIVLGDSHSLSFINAIGAVASKRDAGVVYWGKTGCPTLDGIRYKSISGRRRDACQEFNDWAFEKLDELESNIPIIIINRTSGYAFGGNERADGGGMPEVYFTDQSIQWGDERLQKEVSDSLIETACRLSKERPVYLMRPTPEHGIDVPKELARNLVLGKANADISLPLAEYKKRHALVWAAQDQVAEQCGVNILNPLPYLCDSKVCYGSIDGRPLYYDDDHINEYGNRLLKPMFASIFDRKNKPDSRVSHDAKNAKKVDSLI